MFNYIIVAGLGIAFGWWIRDEVNQEKLKATISEVFSDNEKKKKEEKTEQK